ncbi:hypothetical protein V7S43_015881 [Phytophthora oleae]|uniref:Uncharacterized protein n=1 Tax=Phytophthora oleae TaxID=2107226 RepID=A0ABD3EXS2_9STRA
MTQRQIGRNTTAATWDTTARSCIESIKLIRRRETRRRKERVHALEAQRRAHLLTRQDLLDLRVEELREDQELRMGQRLERTTEQLRWQFKRVSNWEKDQTVSTIHRINGKPFQRGMTIADKFASEWSPILSQPHNEVTGIQLEAEFDRFTAIPKDRKLEPDDNQLLMKEVTQDEVVSAFESLNRHKKQLGPMD